MGNCADDRQYETRRTQVRSETTLFARNPLESAVWFFIN